jgi:hypothetical protein
VKALALRALLKAGWQRAWRPETRPPLAIIRERQG